jgi:hypothetical protein
MVKDNTFFDILLKHPYQFSAEEKKDLERISKKYPFFQTAKSMQLKFLKERQMFLKDLLAETAAQTIDRKVLFMYVEDNQLLFRNKEKKTSKNIEKEIDNKAAKDEEKFVQTNNNNSEKSIEKIVEIAKQKEEKAETIVKTEQKMSYLDWLEQINQDKKQKNNDFFDAIDTFLKNKPKIVPVKNKTYKAPAIIEESVTEKQMLMTETLANLYVKQKKYDKAIQAFKILSLKYPKKSSYFANRISEIKQN